MTTYDDIWQEFITNYKTSEINLPNTNEKRYNTIRSAVRHYNNRVGDNIICDDDVEEVNRILDDNELIIICHYIRLSCFENQLIDFSSTWTPFSKDIGIKVVQSQISSLHTLVKMEQQKIENLIMYSSEDYL